MPFIHSTTRTAQRQKRGRTSRGKWGIGSIIVGVSCFFVLLQSIYSTGLDEDLDKDVLVQAPGVVLSSEESEKSKNLVDKNSGGITAAHDVKLSNNNQSIKVPTKTEMNEAEEARQNVHGTLHDSRRSPIGEHEPILTFFLSDILREEDGLLLPEGSILDCGAQFGEQGAHYAVTSPDRKVLSMDPSPKLVKHMQDKYGSLANFEVRQGGLGREVGTMKPRDDSFNMDKDVEFPIYTLDSMYFDKGEKLAFAHLDVEGLEFDVLNGGLKTIRANKPVFTVELRVHETSKTKQLLDLIDNEGYDTYVIDEVCGWPHIDFRNVLCIPRKRSEAFGKSDGFNLLLATGALKRVTSEDIAEVVLPCCSLGGECCVGDDLNGKDCCTEKVVIDWYDKHKEVDRPPPVMLGFKTARKEFLTQQYRLRQRQKMG